MILNISSQGYKHLFEDRKLFLPIRWDGNDFSLYLKQHLDYYLNVLEKKDSNDYQNFPVDISKIKRVVGLITKSVDHYLNGFPSKAYSTFDRAMKILIINPLKVYHKSVLELFDINGYCNDEINLYRVVKVYDNKPYDRSRTFHTPFNMRSKVSTSRYSIAGYPSLYLGTSLQLCCEEIHIDPYRDLALASLFKLEREMEYTGTDIKVIELGIKPQDFISINQNNDSNRKRSLPTNLLNDDSVMSSYLLWYPLIAASSFIRTSKSDPFAAEYIIPQLLMQWIRSEMESGDDEYSQLVGIRYFSCASQKASDMGFNYVFPTSGQPLATDIPFCKILSQSFRWTTPVYIHESDELYLCERELRKKGDFGSIIFK